MTALKRLKGKTKRIPLNLFFIELIIILLFFSISGAVVLKLFASADIIEEKSFLTGHAVMNVQSLSEIYAGTGDMRRASDELFGSGWYTEDPDGVITICLDNEMKPLLTEDARRNYGRVNIVLDETRTKGNCGELCSMTGKVYLLGEGGTEIYSQVCSAYIPDFERGSGR